jgi:hypothetical protein
MEALDERRCSAWAAMLGWQSRTGRPGFSAFGDYVGYGLIGGMAEAQVKAADLSALGKFCRLAVKRDSRRVTAFADDLDLAPADVAIPAGADRLHHRLFCREAGCVTLITRTAARFAVSDLAVRENTAAKTKSRCWMGKRVFYAIDFDNIDAGADYRHSS